MDWIGNFLTVERLGLISVGAILLGAVRWLYLQFHGNRLPKEGEPIIYVEQLTDRLPNGRVFAVSIYNPSSAPIWLEELLPRSRAFGCILPVPREALSNDATLQIDASNAPPSALLRRRVEAGCSAEYCFWIGGAEWPVWRFVQTLRWSPYGPAARMLKTIVHCST